MRAHRIHIDQPTLDDLQTRLRRARLPRDLGQDWEHGTNRAFLREMLDYWRDGFDWRAQEVMLNELPQFVWQDLHFVYQRSAQANATPLVLLHGWPDSCFRYRKVIPRFADLGFDVIAPTLPGFPLSPGDHSSNRETAQQIWRLLTQELHCDRFVVAGGDGGSVVGQILALDHPESVSLLHLTDIGWHATMSLDPNQVTFTEKRFLEHSKKSFMKDGPYAMLQSTRPRDLAPALNDSPVALASWVLDRYHSWSDRGFSKDELLTNLTLYWATQKIGSSIFSYYAESRAPSLSASEHVERPVAVANFPKDNTGGNPPRKLAERTLNVQRWSESPRGGHFAALEEPDLYVRDVLEAVRELSP
jgi:pimeloyl-ACP methyl ester carboxylesterase